MAKGNSTYIKLKGTGKWMHRLFEPDEKFGYYGMDFYPDKKSFETFVKAGCQAHTREDDEGGQYVKLKLVPQRLVKGQLMDFGKPLVEDADEATWDPARTIRNGSGVEVTIVTYPTEKGVGTRLHRVKVLKHVEYIPQDPAMEDAA